MKCTKCGAEIEERYLLVPGEDADVFHGDVTVQGVPRLEGREIKFTLCKKCFTNMAVRYLGVDTEPHTNDVLFVVNTYGRNLHCPKARTVFSRIAAQVEEFDGHIIISSPEDCVYIPALARAVHGSASNHVIQVMEDGNPDRRSRALSDALHFASDGGKIIFCGAFTDTGVENTALAAWDRARAQGSQVVVAGNLCLGTNPAAHNRSIAHMADAGLTILGDKLYVNNEAS